MNKILISFFCVVFLSVVVGVFVWPGCSPDVVSQNKKHNQEIAKTSGAKEAKAPSSMPASTPFIKQTRIIVPHAEVGNSKDPKTIISPRKDKDANIQVIKSPELETSIEQTIERAIQTNNIPVIYVEKQKESVAQMSITLPDHGKDIAIIKWLIVALVSMLAIVCGLSIFRFVLFIKNKKYEEAGSTYSCD